MEPGWPAWSFLWKWLTKMVLLGLAWVGLFLCMQILLWRSIVSAFVFLHLTLHWCKSRISLWYIVIMYSFLLLPFLKVELKSLIVCYDYIINQCHLKFWISKEKNQTGKMWISLFMRQNYKHQLLGLFYLTKTFLILHRTAGNCIIQGCFFTCILCTVFYT